MLVVAGSSLAVIALLVRGHRRMQEPGVKTSWEAESRARGGARRGLARWKEAGAIDAATLAAIEAEYPVSGRRLAAVWRVLVFLLVSVAVHALFWGVFTFVGTGTLGARVHGLTARLLAIAAEVLRSSRLQGNGRRRPPPRSGRSSISRSALAVLLMQNLHLDDGPALTFALRLRHRWRSRSPAPAGDTRPSASWRPSRSFSSWRAFRRDGSCGSSPDPRRRGRGPEARPATVCARRTAALWKACLAAGAVAIYAAVNLFSLDRGLVEEPARPLGTRALAPGGRAAASAIATALVPVVFLVWGLKSRRRTLLRLGALFAALSLVTLRYYVHLAPLWAISAASGVGLLLVALALNRRLRSSPGGEWGGFTASPSLPGPGRGAFRPPPPSPASRPDASPAPEPRPRRLSPRRRTVRRRRRLRLVLLTRDALATSPSGSRSSRSSCRASARTCRRRSCPTATPTVSEPGRSSGESRSRPSRTTSAPSRCSRRSRAGGSGSGRRSVFSDTGKHAPALPRAPCTSTEPFGLSTSTRPATPSRRTCENDVGCWRRPGSRRPARRRWSSRPSDRPGSRSPRRGRSSC